MTHTPPNDIERRVSALEARQTALETAQAHTHEMAVAAGLRALEAVEAHRHNTELLNALRETQAEHTERLDRIEVTLAEHTGMFGTLTTGMHAIETLLRRIAPEEPGQQ